MLVTNGSIQTLFLGILQSLNIPIPTRPSESTSKMIRIPRNKVWIEPMLKTKCISDNLKMTVLTISTRRHLPCFAISRESTLKNVSPILSHQHHELGSTDLLFVGAGPLWSEVFQILLVLVRVGPWFLNFFGPGSVRFWSRDRSVSVCGSLVTRSSISPSIQNSCETTLELGHHFG